MSQRANILQELAELKSTLGAVNAQNIYAVPVGYFEGLEAQMLQRIKAIEAVHVMEKSNYISPMLNSISKQMPYTVPVGYFETLENKLIQHVQDSYNHQTAVEELATLSPLLSGLKKQMSARPGYTDGPYAVPQGYFESLTDSKNVHAEELNEAGNKPVSKIISINWSMWLRIAAAAVVAGIIVIAGFLGSAEKEPGGKALAKLTRDVKKMDEAQKDKLIDFIDAGMNGEETVRVKSEEVKTLLQGISEDELTDFQEQTEDIEGVLMTN